MRERDHTDSRAVVGTRVRGAAAWCGSDCVRVRARRNIGRAHCDESVLIITLVRGTSRDAFADTYDKLSVYQQISFPNPAIFPLVYPRPSGEHRATARSANVAVFPSFHGVYTCVYLAAVRDCRVHKSAMTAEGRAFLPNKVGERNRNVGINEFIRRLSGIAGLRRVMIRFYSFWNP